MTETITIQFDGGSRGNPGPAGIGVVLRAQDGTPIVTLGRFIGRATNNVAEYKALIVGLEKARELGATKISIKGDSELIVKQMLGEYRVKNPDLKVLYESAQRLFREFDKATIGHNYREDNSLADKLANLAMDRKGEVTDVMDTGRSVPVPPPIQNVVNNVSACPRCGCEITIQTPSRFPADKLRDFTCQCGNKMNRASDEV
jgi:ribonuclease HI